MYGAIADLTTYQRWMNILTGSFGFIYALFLPALIIAFGRWRSILWWLLVLVNGLVIAWLTILEKNSLPGISLFTYLILLLGSAVLAGRWYTYAFVACSLLTYHFLPLIVQKAPVQVTTLQHVEVVLASIVLTETVCLLLDHIQRHFQRLAVVNQMTRSLAFSIEISQVVSLMSAAIQSVLDADTYYIGFVHDDLIDFELFYDDGEFFPSTSIPVDGSLAGWVLKHRKPLLLTDTIIQLPQLGLPSLMIGKPHISLSWMGIPLQSKDMVYGIVAVASYRREAFDAADLELLENFAQQASISLDNATHHAEVERRSMEDSLTGALNHGNFLKSLAAEAEKALTGGYPLSLIMLDVDFFKQYNDTYGHQVGDQVLVSLTGLIRGYIKSTDLLGRWGGEEFTIALPNSTGRQALQVAERIRVAITRLELYDREHRRIPPPTISQGIAVFPLEADQVDLLIDLADRRLYVAKERGRDQIEPVPEANPRLAEKKA